MKDSTRIGSISMVSLGSVLLVTVFLLEGISAALLIAFGSHVGTASGKVSYIL